MIQYIDTHTHLYEEAFAGEGETDAAIMRAAGAGVTGLVFPDIDSKTRQLMFETAGKHEGTVFPCLGLHPTSVGADWKNEYALMEEWTGKKIYAIGEIGMDCHWSRDFIREQKEVLRMQLELAHRLNLPVIIHSRESTELIFEVLGQCRHLDLRGVFHAFGGSPETFSRLQKYGCWYVGIGGTVTYRNASVAETIRHIPADRILLETDSPYLTPVPKRGTRNESSYIPYIAAKVAEQKGMDICEVAEVTTANAVSLFGLGKPDIKDRQRKANDQTTKDRHDD